MYLTMEIDAADCSIGEEITAIFERLKMAKTEAPDAFDEPVEEHKKNE